MKLKYSIFANNTYAAAINKLFVNSKIPTIKAIELSNLYEELSNYEKSYNRIRKNAILSFGTIKDTGFEYKDSESEKALLLRINELMDSEFELLSNPIVFKLSNVDDYELNLSALEINVLKDIVKFI